MLPVHYLSVLISSIFSLCLSEQDLKFSLLSDYVQIKNYRMVTVHKYSEDTEANINLNNIFKHAIKDLHIYAEISIAEGEGNMNQYVDNSTSKSFPFDDGCPARKEKNGVLHITGINTQKDAKHLREMFQKCEDQVDWLIYLSDAAQNYVGYLPLDINNKMVFATLSSDKTEILLIDYYRALPEADLEKHLIGVWIPSSKRGQRSGVIVNPRQPEDPVTLKNFNVWRWRTNLSGVLIRFMCFEFEHYWEEEKDSHGNTVLKGSFVDLLHYLQNELNFTYKCGLPEDGTFGSYDAKTRSWIGAVKELQENRSDIIIAFMDDNSSRRRVIDYFIPLEHIVKSIVYARPKHNYADSWKKYITEFCPLVWGIMILILITFWAALFTISRLNHAEIRISKSDSFILIFAALCNTCSEYYFRSYSGRIGFIALYITTYLLHVNYTSFLISSLTVDKPVPPFTNLKGFSESDYKFVTVKGYSAEDYFRISRIPLYNYIWKTKIEPYINDFPTTHEKLEEMVLKGKYATIENTKYLRPHLICRLSSYPFNMKVFQGWAVRKSFPFKDVINYRLAIFLEAGLFSRSVRASKRKKDKKVEIVCSALLKHDHSIPISSIYFVLQLFTGGLVLSVLILIAEKLLKRK